MDEMSEVMCDECERVFLPGGSVWSPQQTHCFDVTEGPLQGHYHACSSLCHDAVKRAIERLSR